MVILTLVQIRGALQEQFPSRKMEPVIIKSVNFAKNKKSGASTIHEEEELSNYKDGLYSFDKSNNQVNPLNGSPVFWSSPDLCW